MAIKLMQAKCATSQFVKRLDISFDEKSGLIVTAEEAKKTKAEVDYYYDDDCLLFAGMGDIHIHAREDVSQKNIYKEDFHSTEKAAFNGGLVHVADMPNNPIAPVDDSSYLEKFKLTQKVELPILLYAGIGPLTRPLSFKVPYKVYMGPSIGELFFKDNQSLDEVLQFYRGEWVSFHCEDPEILECHKGESSHELRRPLEAEIMATKTALKLIEKYQLNGKLCHYSAGAGLQSIVEAKSRGVNVKCEVTPQHLYYSIERLKDKSAKEQTYFQMNPPIRYETDRHLLLKALIDGHIDYLATDHAPHSKEEKDRGMSGLPGLDTYSAFVTWLLVDQNIDPRIIARVASENPGYFFNEFLDSLNKKTPYFTKWGKGMGFLAPGFSASFTILNLKKPLSVSAEMLATKAGWSPFLGVTFPGQLSSLFLAGKKL